MTVEEAPRVPKVFSLTVELGLRRGRTDIGKPETITIDQEWSVKINGSSEMIDMIPSWGMRFSRHGKPVGIVGMSYGGFVGSHHEDELIAALETAINALPEVE